MELSIGTKCRTKPVENLIFAGKTDDGFYMFKEKGGCRMLREKSFEIMEPNPIIDWDQIERDYSAMVNPNSHTFNWFKEQVSKYIP